jgi:hypothetical protein
MHDAGFTKDEARVIVVPGFEREGNLVAEYSRAHRKS